MRCCWQSQSEHPGWEQALTGGGGLHRGSNQNSYRCYRSLDDRCGGVKMTGQVSPEQDRLARVLFPHFYDRYLSARLHGTRFVHYTTADAAMNILRSREVWMRKSSCMNDFLEVQYGLTRLYRAYLQTDTGKMFKSILNELFEGITADIEKLFDSWTPHFQTNTYFTCMSEHETKEDTYGRLSMWRAYDQGTGVALVLNNSVFLAPADRFGAYSSPVAYLDDAEFEKQFGRVVTNIREEVDFIRQQGREAMTGRIFQMLRFASLCTKHPGFAEEKEWRVIYCPTLEESPYLTKEIQVVRGVPQPIYKIPLRDIPEIGLLASVPSLLNRIIIGPTHFPVAVAEAFHQLLVEAGVPDAESRVCVSDIPLRR
jgi:Protein of unknown function (DUF2971)